MSNKKILLTSLITQAIYYAFLILSFFDYEYSGEGVGLAFGFWIYSCLIALINIPLHIWGAVRNISGNKKLAPIVYLILSILAIPLFIFIGASASIVCGVIWNIYYLILKSKTDI